jgi:hypothetical protein
MGLHGNYHRRKNMDASKIPASDLSKKDKTGALQRMISGLVLSSCHRFWEVDCCFKCPVVGICLTFAEQKHILKKAGISFNSENRFEIHEVLVACSDDESPLSRRVDSFLNRKFKNLIKPLLSLNEKAFMQQWENGFKNGKYEGCLWIAALRSGLSITARREIFGAVHMAMHKSADQDKKLKKRLSYQQAQNLEMGNNLNAEVRARKALQKEKVGLEKNLKELTHKITRFEKDSVMPAKKTGAVKRMEAIEDGKLENNRLKTQINLMTFQAGDQKKQMLVMQKQHNRLLHELACQQEVNQRFKREIKEIIAQFSEMNTCSRDCPAFDLCRKRILIVGGITRMESLYRQLIEGAGGVFEYHDGYMKKGVKGLEGRFKRADVVLCPVSCNSHAACSLVKNLGKKHNKPVHMLAQFSLNAVSQVIRGADKCSCVIN